MATTPNIVKTIKIDELGDWMMKAYSNNCISGQWKVFNNKKISLIY